MDAGASYAPGPEQWGPWRLARAGNRCMGVTGVLGAKAEDAEVLSVRSMGLLAQPARMPLSPLLFQITSVCFSLRTCAESTAVSPLFTVCVTLSGIRWAAGWTEGGVRG